MTPGAKRLFLDANVLFTAVHHPAGLSRLLFDLARHNVLVLMTSAVALQEARSNLLRKAPDRAPGLDLLLPLITLVETPPPIVAVPALPVDDELILRAAIAAGATHLLTGDKKHFGRYFDAPARTAGVRIQTVRMFLTDCFELRREPGKS